MEMVRPHSDLREETVLVHQACAGDARAFTVLVERYKGPIYNLCYRYVPGPDAEDLAQETFLRAFVNRERFDTERPFLPWLMVIARNLCLDRLRQRRREPVSGPDISTISDRLPSAEENAVTRQELSDLARGLSTLPEGQREAIALYHLDGLSYREISEVMEAPVGTIMTWLHRGRLTLQSLLRREPTNELSMKKSGAKNPRGSEK